MNTQNFFLPEPFRVWADRPLSERLEMMDGYTKEIERRSDHKRMGWLYTMLDVKGHNPMFRLDSTKRFPTNHLQELTDGLDSPGRFDLAYFVHVGDRKTAEAEAHRLLTGSLATGSGGMYGASFDRVLDVMDKVAERFPLWAGPKRAAKPLAQPFLVYHGECEKCGSKVRLRELLVEVSSRCSVCGTEI